MLFNTILLSALAANVLAAPAAQKSVVHEKRAVPADTKGARVARDAVIPVRIGLKQSNLDSMYEEVMEVSDPTSSKYGKHWSLEEVRAHFAPSEEAINAVKEWLVGSGIDGESIDSSDDKAWIAINLPVHKAEELLGAEYHEHDAQDGSVRIGCDEYYLPQHISEHVDYIKPGVSLSPPLEKKQFQRRAELDLSVVSSDDSSDAPQQSPANAGSPFHSPPGMKPMPSNMMSAASGANAASLATCDELITPACIRALYDFKINNGPNTKNAFGVVEFSPDAYNQRDLNMFFRSFAPYVPSGTGPQVISIDNGKAPVPQGQAGGESDIDFDLAISLTYPQTVTLYQVGAVSFNQFSDQQFLNEVTFLVPFLDAIDGSFCTNIDRQSGFDCGTATSAKVYSVSYGFAELMIGQNAVVRTCNEIAKLSLRGSTFVFASGDYGVASVPGTGYNGCINKSLRLGQSGTIFSPDFPVDCPYVLGVGGTQLNPGQTVNDKEVVLNQPDIGTQSATFSSGGGFSNYFKRPSYQNAAVTKYLNTYAPAYKSYVYNGQDIFSGKSNIGQNGGIYNRNGRGFPDVAANGANFGAFIMGSGTLTYGTSLSAPIWASLLTIINEDRLAAGQPSVGFVNPVLYANPGAFFDITQGTNPGCGTQGFPASPGWDPSTGLGTPNFPRLQEVFKAAGSAAGTYGGDSYSYSS